MTIQPSTLIVVPVDKAVCLTGQVQQLKKKLVWSWVHDVDMYHAYII